LQALDALAARVASFTGLEQPTANAVPDAQAASSEAASSEAASSHAASSNATATQGRAGALPEGAAAARAPAATPAPAAAAGASAAAAAAATAPPAAAPVPAPAAGSLPGQPLGPAHPLDTSSAAQVRALASVHTRSFAEVLERAGASLAVSTYQAGKLVLVRSDGAGGVNTHFREMRKPMGIACDGNRLAVGTANEIQTFHSVPAVTPRLDPSGRVDAAWLPRSIHFTGNIDIHEMAYANDGVLWSVNTRFSCLCTVEEANSFVPRWKPSFLTALAPEDRCHLN